MAESASKPVFLVDAASDPVLVRIDGRACFQNCAGLRDFITTMAAEGRRRFVIDFRDCASMDSTFLGVLAGAAMALRRLGPEASLVAARPSPANLQLMRSLGLHRLLTLAPAVAPAAATGATTGLESKSPNEIESARLVLAAHEQLVAADESNRAKFEDVMAILRQRLGSP
ncbi:MAG: STAS domain-containing protein [Opitutaceae bacterium]|nr:STAS domain-containing protein [Opitutaceae bacterium]